MTKAFLRTLAAGFGTAALVCAATSAQAQDTNTVGNPQLRDFELPGTRTTPPVQTNEQQPTPTPTPTPAPAAEPPAAETPAAEAPATPPPAEAEPAPARERTVRRETAREEERDEEATEIPAGVPAPAELEQALPTAAPSASVPTPRTEWGPVVPLENAEQPFPWLYAGLGLAALLALLAFLFMRRRRAATVGAPEEFAIAEPEAPQPPAAEPDPIFARRSAQPAPAAPPPMPKVAPPAPAPSNAVAQDGGTVGISLRPRLELEFRPDRAAATLTETSVQFELIIRNVGNRTARDIRVQTRMFNAGADQDREIGEFYAAPVSKDQPPSIAAIPPRGDVQLRSVVTLPKEQVREITIQGRRLFIPMVAFNVLYEWEGGRTGQTSMSYLVGREPSSPQEKMGAFRLDLGPRLYRQVGQRQASLAKVL